MKLVPLFGCLLFILLYFIATLYYPGGSQADKNAAGFSWVNNYWCNLLNETAMNGKPNPARPVAMLAMFILCLSLCFFWIQFPQQTGFTQAGIKIIQLSGVLSMIMAFFVFTSFHDSVINMAGVFGLVALGGTYAGLYKSKWYFLFAFGIFNLLLIALNNFLYYTKGLLLYLPVVQKISFLFFLLWICLIDIKLFLKHNFHRLRSIRKN